MDAINAMHKNEFDREEREKRRMGDDNENENYMRL